MLPQRLTLALLTTGACAAAVGCGSAKTPASVQLSLTAPVNGATVVVPKILMVGTIEPRDGHVMVAGKKVRVTNGAFRQPLFLTKRLTTIDVRVIAPRHVGARTEIAVHYTPSRGGRPPSGRTSASQGAAPAPIGGARNSSSGTGAFSSGGAASAERDSVMGCTSSGASTAGCECVYAHLVKERFASQAQWDALFAFWRRSFRANGTIAYPPAVRKAILACSADS